MKLELKCKALFENIYHQTPYEGWMGCCSIGMTLFEPRDSTEALEVNALFKTTIWSIFFPLILEALE
jgi:hypothetical protein